MKNKGFKSMAAVLVAGIMITTNYFYYVVAEENTAVEKQTQEAAEEWAKAVAEAATKAQAKAEAEAKARAEAKAEEKCTEEGLIEIEDYDTPLGLGNVQPGEMTATIWSSKNAGTQAGDVITLNSSISGFDGCRQVVYQWMCDRGNGYEAVLGANGPSYSYTADTDSLNWGWRLIICYN